MEARRLEMSPHNPAVESSPTRTLQLLILTIVLGVSIFGIDLTLPLGVAIPMGYIGPVLITLWLPRHSDTLAAAAVATLLTVLGALISPPGGVVWIGVVNRALAIAIVWMTAALVLLHKRATEHIDLLRRWLPVCASCKKIRDDQGFWQGLEEFVEQHSDVLFTHSLCPDCIEKWTPELHPQLVERHPEIYKE